MGRPSDYTQATADEICERLSEGESLRAICLDDNMPHKATVFRWLAANEEFRDQYARAREAQADVLVDEMIYIADGKHGGEDVQRDRLSVDARKWAASKLKPKTYGDKVKHVGGDEGDNPIAFTGFKRQFID
jgi:hypothetical protein